MVVCLNCEAFLWNSQQNQCKPRGIIGRPSEGAQISKANECGGTQGSKLCIRPLPGGAALARGLRPRTHCRIMVKRQPPTPRRPPQTINSSCQERFCSIGPCFGIFQILFINSRVSFICFCEKHFCNSWCACVFSHCFFSGLVARVRTWLEWKDLKEGGKMEMGGVIITRAWLCARRRTTMTYHGIKTNDQTKVAAPPQSPNEQTLARTPRESFFSPLRVMRAPTVHAGWNPSWFAGRI